jgi:RNA recognition motif-containing protein
MAQPSTSQTSSTQRQPAQNMPQVSANKAMLDAQKAMAMQTKEPPVMGPQITPKSIEDKALSNKAKKNIKYVRTAGGEVWEDSSLAEWDPNDFRIFCGDLGNEVNDEALARAFRKYPTFQKAKIIRDKKSNKSKGYGFVSFKDPNDFVRAMKEMNGKYVGNRPIKLRKSQWKERQLNVAKKRVREKQKLGMRT